MFNNLNWKDVNGTGTFLINCVRFLKKSQFFGKRPQFIVQSKLIIEVSYVARMLDIYFMDYVSWLLYILST